MIFKRLVMLVSVACVCLLSGCDLDRPVPSKHFVVRARQSRLKQLAKITHWRAAGSFSVIQPGHQPGIANYIWKQFGKNYRISITSALDLYHIEIIRQFGYVTLWKNQVFVTTAKTPERLMRKALGWSLPISPLSSWLKGVPAPGIRYRARYDYFGHLIWLKQAGWIITFKNYKRHDDKYEDPMDLPQIILLERPGFAVKIYQPNWMPTLERFKKFGAP